MKLDETVTVQNGHPEIPVLRFSESQMIEYESDLGKRGKHVLLVRPLFGNDTFLIRRH